MYEKTTGIVLYQQNYKEKDALIKILTQSVGKKMFFIKGYHRPNFPLKAALMPLTLNAYVAKINPTGLSFISEGNNLKAFRYIQSDYERQAYAVYISQLIDAVGDDNVPMEAVFHYFALFLDKLNQGVSPEVLTVHAELFLLPFFGVYFHWHDCVICHRVDHPLDFSMRLGGILCHRHFDRDPHRLHSDPKAMYVAHQLVHLTLDQIGQIQLRPETITGLRDLTDCIYEEYVGIHPKSKSYLDRMRKDFPSAMD